MIMIKCVSIEAESAIKINKLVENGEYKSFSAFIRKAVSDKLEH